MPTRSALAEEGSARPPIRSKADLRTLQRAVFSAVAQPLTPNYEANGDSAGGAALARTAQIFIKPNDRMTGFERLAIYNKQYWFRLLDCLADDFPGLRRVLGDKRFDALARAYLQTNPSRSYSLRHLGAQLPEFLREQPSWSGRRQTLAVDMARFEWAQVEAFDGPQHRRLSIDDLLGRDAAKLTLRLQPYITLLELRYPLDDFAMLLKKSAAGTATEGGTTHLRVGSKEAVILPRRERTWLAVHRFDNGIYYKRLDGTAYVLLTALRDGATLAAACATALERKASTLTPDTLKEWFHTWTQLGWFCTKAA